ncbi:hypothetical protein [Vibrio vulnificus]|uniref:hypothetical protein n=1 Tax=Vibrio vulnificus TaxID=672 RepID=UPI003EDAA06E
MNDEPKVNIDEFIQCLKREISRLPVDDLELCDLSNEIGRVIAMLAGADKRHEQEVVSGVEHGFDLIRHHSGENLER